MTITGHRTSVRVFLAGVTLLATGRFAPGAHGAETTENAIGWFGPFADLRGNAPLLSTVPAQR